MVGRVAVTSARIGGGRGAPGDQVRQSIDQLLVILKDPRRTKLKEVIYQRFDFTEMARRSLGPEWRVAPQKSKRSSSHSSPNFSSAPI